MLTALTHQVTPKFETPDDVLALASSSTPEGVSGPKDSFDSVMSSVIDVLNDRQKQPSARTEERKSQLVSYPSPELRHPILVRPPTTTDQGSVFETPLYAQQRSNFADHIVSGRVVFPAAGFIEVGF